jgi:hypothetical protein
MIPKPGVKTTEFWGKTLLQLVIILNMLFGLGIEMSAEQAMVIVGGLEGIYALVRGLVKRKEGDVAVAKLEIESRRPISIDRVVNISGNGGES